MREKKDTGRAKGILLVGLPGLALVGGFAILVMWSPTGSTPTAPAENAMGPDADDPALVALGAKVYRDSCASCHGVDLEGQPNWRERGQDGRLPAPPHDETGHTWHHPDQVLFEITKYGIEAHAPEGYESDMPAFEHALSDKEIRAALAYIKSKWPDREKNAQARIDRQAREARE